MRNAVIGLFVLNAILLGAVVWLFMNNDGGEQRTEGPVAEDTVISEADPAEMDSLITALPPDAKVAYFFMDSVNLNYQLLIDKKDLLISEQKRLDGNFRAQQRRAEARYKELVEKDYTYSTKEEVQQSEREVQELMPKLQQYQAQAEDQLARLELSILEQVSTNVAAFLEDYNDVQGLDFIYSIQNGGQIWVGNEGLDITNDVLNGLNHAYRKTKGTQAKPVAVDSIP